MAVASVGCQGGGWRRRRRRRRLGGVPPRPHRSTSEIPMEMPTSWTPSHVDLVPGTDTASRLLGFTMGASALVAGYQLGKAVGYYKGKQTANRFHGGDDPDRGSPYGRRCAAGTPAFLVLATSSDALWRRPTPQIEFLESSGGSGGQLLSSSMKWLMIAAVGITCCSAIADDYESSEAESPRPKGGGSGGSGAGSGW